MAAKTRRALGCDWQPIRVRGTSMMAEEDRESIWFRPFLWSQEEAWKMRVEFSRKETAEFAPEELWTIRRIKVPDSGSFTELNLKTNLNGLEVNLIGLAGAQARLPDGNDYYRGEDRLEVNVADLPEGMHLTLVSAKSEHGAEVPRGGAGWGGGKYSFALRFLSEDAKWLDLTLALHRSRFAEYLVKPNHLIPEPKSTGR